MGIFLYLVSIDNFKAHLAAACAFGFFGTYNFAILLNFGGELIYPESESTSSSILLMLNNGVSVRVRRARVPLVCHALKFARIFHN